MNGRAWEAHKCEAGAVEAVSSMREEIGRAVVTVCRGGSVAVGTESEDGAAVAPGHIPSSYVWLRGELSRMVEADAKLIWIDVGKLWEEGIREKGILRSEEQMHYALEFLSMLGVVVWFRQVERIKQQVFVRWEWVVEVAMMPLSMYHYVHPDRAVAVEQFKFDVSLARDIHDNRGVVRSMWYQVWAGGAGCIYRCACSCSGNPLWSVLWSVFWNASPWEWRWCEWYGSE